MHDYKVTYEPVVPVGELISEKDWAFIGQIVKRNISDGIQAQVDVTGAAYPALRPNTIASKEAAGNPEPGKRLIATGNLLNSAKYQTIANGVEIRLGPQRAQIGRYHQEGIKPHTITPKKAERLAFTTTEGPVFAGRVQHPGTEPVPFFGISQKCAQDILAFVDSLTQKWLSGRR